MERIRGNIRINRLLQSSNSCACDSSAQGMHCPQLGLVAAAAAAAAFL
jgi:hypothetical protein